VTKTEETQLNRLESQVDNGGGGAWEYLCMVRKPKVRRSVNVLKHGLLILNDSKKRSSLDPEGLLSLFWWVLLLICSSGFCSIIGNLDSFWIQFCFWVWKFGAWFEMGLSKNYRDCVIWLVSYEIFCWIIEIWGFETWCWLVMDCKHTLCWLFQWFKAPCFTNCSH